MSANNYPQITSDIAYEQPGQSGQRSLARAKLRADPSREYVAGGSIGWVPSPLWLRSLPLWIDDITAEFGDDLYERMMFDSKVSSAIEGLKLSALSEGLHLHSAITDENDPGYKEAMSIRDFCQAALDVAETPLLESLMDMLDAMAFGNRAAEIVLKGHRTGRLAGYWGLRYLKPKPRRAVAYVVDPMNNIKGILAQIPGTFSPVLVETTIIDPTLPNFIPREKFAILTFLGRNGDPRGRSLLRSAYTPWWLKQQGYPAYLKYLATFAVPSVIGTTAPDADEQQALDETGNPLLKTDGSLKMLTPEEVMTATLLHLQNASAAAFPNGSTVTPLEVKDGIAPYEAFIDARNREISDAITGQTLASMEGQHNARAAAEVHQDEKGVRVSWARTAVEEMLRSDLLYLLVKVNFSEEEANRFTPRPSLSGSEPHDFVAVAGAVGELWGKNYLSPSQLSATDRKLGLPARTPEEMRAINYAARVQAENSRRKAFFAPVSEVRREIASGEAARAMKEWGE